LLPQLHSIRLLRGKDFLAAKNLGRGGKKKKRERSPKKKAAGGNLPDVFQKRVLRREREGSEAVLQYRGQEGDPNRMGFNARTSVQVTPSRALRGRRRERSHFMEERQSRPEKGRGGYTRCQALMDHHTLGK